MDSLNGLSFGSIEFIAGPMEGSTLQISKPLTLIGRDPARNDIFIDDPFVAQQHIRLIWRNGACTLENAAQTDDIRVNGRKTQQVVLSNRDIIDVGLNTSFRFLAHIGSNGSGYTPDSSRYQLPTSIVSEADAGSIDRLALPGVRNGIPSLEVSSNTRQKTRSFPLARQVINIGRDLTNEIVIKEPLVSDFHLQIVRQGNQLFVVHPHPARERSSSGLLYQGYKIQSDEQYRQPLVRGDVYRIGDEDSTLITLTYNDGTGVEEIVPPIQPIRLGMAELTIGRRQNNMIVINHPQVSEYHAKLVREGSSYRILDLNSTNHVYVNSVLASNQLLKTGDEIRIGPYRLTYTGTQLTQYDESNFVRIDALNLKKLGNNYVTLLNDISISIPPRKFVALVGGSGAGKSTLMDALSGLRPAQQGLVLYNGQDYYKNLAAFSTQLGYVPMDDIVHRDLTIERVLYYAARLRLPADYTEGQIEQRIKEVLEDVEMTLRRKLLVKKLSGGQRKRVSIALELLANPSVFFLDEPTSGLDPGLDRKMMFLLRRLADKGHTIVLVTHATNNINACDFVCFLCQGGRLAYFGPPDQAKTYFGKTDFAEIYGSLEPTEYNPNTPSEAEARFRASPDYQEYVVRPLREGPAGSGRLDGEDFAPKQLKPPKRGNPWQQFWLLSRRNLELLLNDQAKFLFLILLAPIIGAILMFLTASATFNPGSIVTCPLHAPVTDTVGNNTSCQNYVNFFNTQQGQTFMQLHHYGSVNQAVQYYIEASSGSNAQTTLFIIALAAVAFGCINGIREIVKEEAIYKRERMVNLGIMPYMFSKIAVPGALCLLQSAVLVLMVNIKAPFQTSVFLPPIIEIYITTALTALAGLMIGLAISALVPNNDGAVGFMLIILIPQVIFSGILFALNNSSLQFLASFSAIRWAIAAMGSTVGLHGASLGNPNDWAYVGTLYSTNTQTEALTHLLFMWLALVVMMVVSGLFTAYLLKRKDVRV